MATRLNSDELWNIVDGMIDEKDIERIENDTELDEMVLIGTALKQLGDDTLSQARKEALRRFGDVKGPQTMGRVIFQHVPGFERTAINTKEIRALFPISTSPEFYNKSRTKETVKFTITSVARDE